MALPQNFELMPMQIVKERLNSMGDKSAKELSDFIENNYDAYLARFK